MKFLDKRRIDDWRHRWRTQPFFRESALLLFVCAIAASCAGLAAVSSEQLARAQRAHQALEADIARSLRSSSLAPMPEWTEALDQAAAPLSPAAFLGACGDFGVRVTQWQDATAKVPTATSSTAEVDLTGDYKAAKACLARFLDAQPDMRLEAVSLDATEPGALKWTVRLTRVLKSRQSSADVLSAARSAS